MSLNLIFNAKFQNSIIPGIFQKQSGVLEFLLEMTYFLPSSYRVFSPCNFCPELDFQSWITHIEKTRSFLELACFCHFQSIGYYSYLVFILKHDIQCFNSKFHPFWDLPETIWNSGNGMFFALNLILNAEFQNCIIPGISFPNVIILCTFKIIY